MPIQFGKPIDRTKAEELFGHFVKIKSESASTILAALNASALPDVEEKIRYYLGRNVQEPQNDDIAYVFDRQSLVNILNIIDSEGGNGMVLFHGARKEEDSIDENGNITDVDGRPTIMLFACRYRNVNVGGVDKLQVLNLLGIGEQHPGSGRAQINPQNPRLPDEFEPGEVHSIA